MLILEQCNKEILREIWKEKLDPKPFFMLEVANEAILHFSQGTVTVL